MRYYIARAVYVNKQVSEHLQFVDFSFASCGGEEDNLHIARD